VLCYFRFLYCFEVCSIDANDPFIHLIGIKTVQQAVKEIVIWALLLPPKFNKENYPLDAVQILLIVPPSV